MHEFFGLTSSLLNFQILSKSESKRNKDACLVITSINCNNMDKVAVIKRGTRDTCVGATIYTYEVTGLS